MRLLIQTPTTSAAMVKLMRERGYIEHVENYPVAVETVEGFWFVCYDSNADEFIVSCFYKTGDWAWQPAFTTNNYGYAVTFLQDKRLWQ